MSPPLSRPVRWGFLGAGRIAATALGPATAAADGAVLQAAAARDPARAAALEPQGRAYGSYPELLADPSVEAVYIALANDAHRPWSTAALAAGKHVLCEKPLTLSAADVDAVATAAAAADRLVVEASWYRWHPRVQLAARLLADAAVGEVTAVEAAFTFAGIEAGNYRLDPAKGGGALYDIGCYAVSAVLWAFAPAVPREVSAQITWGATGIDETAQVGVRFDTGHAQVHVSVVEPARQVLRVTGTAGVLDLPGSPFASWREPSELRVVTAAGEQRHEVPAVDAYQRMVEDVSRRIRGRDGYLVPLTESRATAAVLDAAFASGRAGGAAVPVR